MKGMIFTEFLEMGEETFGLAVMDRILDEVETSTGGSYTAVGNYDPAELVAMVVKLSELTETPVADLLTAFGHRIFGLFTNNYGKFFEEANSAFEFLSGIENYIHVEVRKLYPDAELPTFDYPEASNGNEMVMEYQSTRPLADFALGLVQATVAHYGDDVTVEKIDLSDGAGTHARFKLTRQ